VLVGLGISPGRAQGRVRIARTLEEASRLQPGEVLVVKATDPGWTPYFAAAAGLVTELGGLLSHAAVVAREYGLPAVANVAAATSVLRDGELVEVDGDSGVIERMR
jgi:phosphoenolpyruvate synthase/pyruvate phosphate dikinase